MTARPLPVRQVIRDADAKIVSVVDRHGRNVRQRAMLARAADDELTRHAGEPVVAYTMITWK